MKLHVGQRLPGSGPAGQPGGYLVTGVVHETPWSNLYTARKILYNFDFANQRCRESDDGEWLDVLLRTCAYEDLQAPQDAARRRAAARDEVRQVLARRTSNVWPEPLDLLDGDESADTDEETRDSEPIIALAHPHGATLRGWLAKQPSLLDRFTLLAELLSLVEATHRDKLLLNGLGPQAFVIDAEGRLGYLASDCVVPMEVPAGPWPHGALFPPERYPLGFSPPECFDPGSPRDQASDLFAWSALAYCVLTSDDPQRLAEMQGSPWFALQPAHADRLQAALGELSLGDLWKVAAVFGVEPETFGAAWPHNIVRIVQRGLALERLQRPASVAQVRRWLPKPPPPAPLAALALALPHGSAVRVYYEMPRWQRALEAIIQDAGAQVLAEGPASGWSVVDSNSPTLRVCLRESDGDGLLSAAVEATRLEPLPTELCRFAQRGAAPTQLDEPEPPHVTLLFRALKPLGVAEALLASSMPAVRLWAARRVAEAWGQHETAAEAEPLLWRAVEDSQVQVRDIAATCLLQGVLTRKRVERLFESLANRPPEEGARALELLARVGAQETVRHAAREALSAGRLVACPECTRLFTQRDLHAHQMEAHGYIEVAGSVLPRAVALNQLWDRLFGAGDREAHNRLVELLAASDPKADGSPPYVRALEAQLRRRGDQILAARWQELPRLVRCLRSSTQALPLLTQLLHSPHQFVQEVAQDVLLAELTARLSSGSASGTDVRGQLDRLCPADQLEDKIRLCALLSRAGVKAEAVAECLTQLELERPVACQLCGALVPRAWLETHLRQEHRVYQFRGEIRSRADTLTALLDAVCRRRPDPQAWPMLEAIEREENPELAGAHLAALLGQRLQRIAADKQPRVLTAVAEAIAASPGAAQIVVALASAAESAWQPLAYQLAMEIAGHLPVPLDQTVLDSLQPRIADRRLPGEVRLRATSHLLKTTGPSGTATMELLQRLVAGSGKVRGIERLQQLEQLTGKMPAIDRLTTELEDQVRMSCPRCNVELQRSDMTRHLWDQHRLMLDGRRVREPWRMIEDWLEDFRVEGDHQTLERCRDLADRLDPRDGSLRLQRLMLQHGIENDKARKALLAQARQQRASLCPHCFALVPGLGEPLLPELHCTGGLIEGGGYRVELSADGLTPRLEIDTPGGMLYDGVEPGRRVTKFGAMLILAGPLFLLTGILAVLPVDWPVPRFIPPALTGGLGLVVLGLILLAGNPSRSLLDRAIDLAWTRLVPPLLDKGLTPQDQAFVAALALQSIGPGDGDARAPLVDEVRDAFEEAVTAGAPASYLGAIWALIVQDLPETTEVVPRMVEQLARCFDGSIPLDFATTFLGSPESDRWTSVDLRRARVLVCARAFDDGLELRELLDAAAANASLAAFLDVKQPAALAQLRLLRSLEPARLWESAGEASTVFKIARDHNASRRLLSRLPDLLLVADTVPPLYICARGLLFDNVWILEAPTVLEIVSRTLFEEGGFHLVIEQHSFWFPEDPEELAESLEKWFRWYFKEFRGQLEAAYRAQAAVAARRLVARNGVPCPECRRRVLAVPGEVGLAADTPARRDEIPVVQPV
jgi:hypothetical protein